MKEIVERILAQYDELIAELEAIDMENRAMVAKANERPDDPEVREWARLARDNKRRLDFARVEREYLQERYGNL